MLLCNVSQIVQVASSRWLNSVHHLLLDDEAARGAVWKRFGRPRLESDRPDEIASHVAEVVTS